MLLPIKDDNPTTRTPWVTLGLIMINVGVMLWLAQLSPLQERITVIEHGFIPMRVAQLSNPNMIVDVPVEVVEPAALVRRPQPPPAQDVRLAPVESQILTTVFTCMFLHGGWLHLAGNMWFLWIFGNNVEERLGSLLYLPFYLAGGVLATACHWSYDPHSTVPVIGASGAVATILGAYAVTFPKANVRTLVFLGVIAFIEIPALAWLGLWFFGELATAFFFGKDLTVAVWAHVGGFVAGACLMPILSFGSRSHHAAWEAEVKKHFSIPPTDGH